MSLPVLVERYLEVLKYDVPKIAVKPKTQSKFLKFVGKVFAFLKISPRFMEQYTTTLGYNIYVPDHYLDDGIDPVKMLEITMHEGVHARDYHKNKLWFVLSYGAPQILALLFVLAVLAPFTSSWMWLCLLFLLLAAPLPSPGRLYWELRAYRVSLVFARHLGYSEQRIAGIKDGMTAQMTGRYYYFTFPLKSFVRRKFEDESSLSNQEYQVMKKFLEQNLGR